MFEICIGLVVIWSVFTIADKIYKKLDQKQKCKRREIVV